ncbi:MAG TPA: hypothetical protein VGD56_20805 [Gemmatirosa sp.]
MREIAIDAIAAGGDGVGRDAGLVVFVPRTAPGDVVRARWASSGRFARGALVEVVRPAPDRVSPPCAHYREDRCGGCQLQHLGLPAQHGAKRQLVADALARIGRRTVDVASVVPSPNAWRYRRKLTLALRRGADGAWIAGLHPYDAPGDVFALRDCPITDERVVGVWRDVMAASTLFPRDADALRGAVRLLGDARDPNAPAAATFTLEGGARWARADEFLAAVPGIAGLWWAPDGGPRRLLRARGDAAAGASFAQVNAGMADRLHADVVAELRAVRPASLVDAYAGTGDVAVALAGDGARVTAIELDGDAAALAGERLAPFGGRVLAARVEDVLAGTLPAAAVLVNPPRTGLDAAAADVLERAAAGAFGAPPDVVVYVSCNPATLARDLGRMPSYGVRGATPYDMFPQTAHVETLVVLEPTTPDRHEVRT